MEDLTCHMFDLFVGLCQVLLEVIVTLVSYKLSGDL